MGQKEIMDILEKAEFPMSRNEIAKELDDEPVNVSKKIKLLLEHREIKCIEVDRYAAARLLNWDNPIRRTRFYYTEIKLREIKKWELK